LPQNKTEGGITMMKASITGNSEAVLLSCSEGDDILASSETMPPARALVLLADILDVDLDEMQDEIMDTL